MKEGKLYRKLLLQMPLAGWLCPAKSPLINTQSWRWLEQLIFKKHENEFTALCKKYFKASFCHRVLLHSLLPAVWWQHLYVPLIEWFYCIGVPWLTLHNIHKEHLDLQKKFEIEELLHCVSWHPSLHFLHMLLFTWPPLISTTLF